MAWASGLVGAAIPTTDYDLIATQLVTTNNTTVAVIFSNIPQIYKQLQIRYTSRTSDNNALRNCSIYPNLYSASMTRSYHFVQGLNNALSSGGTFNVNNIQLPGNPTANTTASIFNLGIIDLLDYTSNTKNKTLKFFGGLAGTSTSNSVISFRSGLSIDTNPITAIEISTDDAGVFWAQGSRFSLYGLKG